MDSVLLHPSYFPTIAQMAAIAQAKEVLFEVQDNYQKQTYRNRALIAHAQGSLLLNIPVKHTHNGVRKRTDEILVEPNEPWQMQHWKSLQTAYRKSPYFEFYEDELEIIFKRPVTHLMEHNLFIFELLKELLGITSEVVLTTEYHKKPQQADFRDLIKVKNSFKIEFQPYIQVFGDRHGFIPNLSILDVLFNEGPNALFYLENQPILPQ